MKKFVALLLAAMMLLAMVACGNDPQPTPDPEPTPEPTVDTTVVDELYAAFDASMAEQLGETPAPNGEKIGAVIISLTNQFWANMKVCYEAAAEKLGVQIDVQTGTTEGDTQSQLDVLMTMADMDYDVIIVSPIDGTNLIPGIVKCNEKGIKVINLGPGVDTAALAEAGGHLDGKITVQFSDQGKIVANDMISRLPEGDTAGGAQADGRTGRRATRSRRLFFQCQRGPRPGPFRELWRRGLRPSRSCPWNRRRAGAPQGAGALRCAMRNGKLSVNVSFDYDFRLQI